MNVKSLYVFLLLMQLSLGGCLGLAVREDDAAAETTGKVITRTLLAVPTIGISEVIMAKQKKDQEARPWMTTSGSHAPRPQGAPPSSDKPAFVVWGNHPAAVSRIIELIQQAGYPIVERSRLDAIFDEQKTRLMHTSEDMPALLRVGQLVGAGRIAFVEAQQRSDTRSGTISTPGAIVPMGNVWITTPPTSESYSVTLYHVSVAVRAVNVEDGTIRWSGTAAYNKPINNPEFALGLLAEGAFRRAVCPIEKGYRWIEQGPWRNKYGCLPPQE